MTKQNETDILPKIIEACKFFGRRMSKNRGGKSTLLIKATWLLLTPVFFLLTYGCAPKMIKLDPEEQIRLKNQSEVQAIHYMPPSFSVMTSGKALAGGGGALGALFSLGLAKSAGDQMVEDYSLQDPALKVKDRFLLSVAANLDLKNVRALQEPFKDDGLSELKKTFGKGMVFDFKTTQWRLFYYPTDWSHYRIAYSAQSRLIRLEDSKIMWQGVCNFVGQDPKTSPTMDELKVNNGALLKAKLNEAADACAEELLAHFFGKEKVEK